jgi:hypothetical protein
MHRSENLHQSRINKPLNEHLKNDDVDNTVQHKLLFFQIARENQITTEDLAFQNPFHYETARGLVYKIIA